MTEIFKDVPGYEGIYQGSIYGNVKSLNYNRTGKEKLLKQSKTNKGYLCVYLYKNGERHEIKVHQLIARTFIPNPANLPEVNHKDENKENNCVDNLEWCTKKYNTRYSHAKPVGCFKDGKLIKKYEAITDVKLDGHIRAHVTECCNGSRYTHHGFNWQFLEG